MNACLSLAGGTAPLWDAGFPAPRAAAGRAMIWRKFHCRQQSLHRAKGPVKPGRVPLGSKTDPINN